MREFYACYLLQSQGAKSRGKTYIGFTVNPKRRIRQHNGEIGAGAWKTKSGRPWSMVLVVYGFPTKVQALQFEWAWQHPEKSKAVRDDVAALVASCKRAGLSGAKGKIRLLMLLLNSEQWRYFPLTVQVLSTDFSKLLHGVDSPPDHVGILYGPAETLPTVVADDFDEGEIKDCDSESEAPAIAMGDADISSDVADDVGPLFMDSAAEGESISLEAGEQAKEAAELDPKLVREAAKLAVRCAVCEEPAKSSWLECPSCTARAHLPCLALHFIQSDPSQPSVPVRGPCPMCGDERTWAEALLSEKHIGWAGRRSGRVRPTLKADPKLKRITASKKPRAKSSSSSGAAPEVDAQTQDQAPETSAKPVKSSTTGRRRATKKAQAVAGEGASQLAISSPDEDDSHKGSKLLQDNRTAETGGNPAAARSTAATARKPPRRRKALVRVAPVLEDSDAGGQVNVTEPSATGHSSAKASKDAGSSSQSSQHCKALAGEPFASSLCNGDDLSPITEEPSSQRSVMRHVSSPADDVAGDATAAQAGQPWALPVQDAWCYIASSPELSMQASPQLAACLSSPRDSHAEAYGNVDSSRNATQMHTSGVAKSSQAGSVHREPISLLSSDSEEERGCRQGFQAAVGQSEKPGKRCRSTRKGAGARGPAPKSPRACSGQTSASAAACAPVLALAAGHVGPEALRETPIVSKLAGKLQLGCSQEALAKEAAVECSPIWLPSPAPLRRRLEGALAMESALGAAQHDISEKDANAAVIDIDLS